MNVKNIFISIIMVLLAVYGGFKMYMHFEAKDKIDKMMSGLQMMGIEAKYDRISTSIFGSIGVQGLTFRLPNITETIGFGEVMINRYEQVENQLPREINISLEDVKFNVRLVDELIKQSGQSEQLSDHPGWKDLGYETIKIDMELDLRFLPAENEFIFNMTQRIKDMWDIRFMMDITEIPVNKPPDPLGVRLKELRLDYKDKSYAERVYKWQANKRGIDLAAYKKQLLEEFEADLAEEKPKLSQESIQNLRAFIATPDKITVTMYPYKPVAFGSVKHYESADVPLLLNLRFIRN
jgi:hypothetical protein